MIPRPPSYTLFPYRRSSDLFWYGCPHCFQLESLLTPWKKTVADDVSVTGVPAQFGRAWVAHAQLYYVADLLGVLDQVHDTIDRKSTRLNSSHVRISYAVFCL